MVFNEQEIGGGEKIRSRDTVAVVEKPTFSGPYLAAFQEVVLRLYRKDQQKSLARDLEVTPSAVNQWCRGKSIPTSDNFYRLVLMLLISEGGKDEKLNAAIKDFFEMAERPIEEVVDTSMVKKFKGCRTVSDYYLLEAQQGTGNLASGLPPKLKLEFWRFTRSLARDLLKKTFTERRNEDELCEWVREGQFL